MKPILVLAWFFPPLNSSEALMTERLLACSRYSYAVFTQRRCASWSYGFEGGWPARENVRCVCAEADTPAAWAEEAVRFAAAHRGDYALLMTRSMPPEAHSAGLRIRALCPELPWVASFGDPIRRNPYELLGGLYGPDRGPRALLWSLRHPAARRQTRALAAIEGKTLRRADRVILNNDSQLRYMGADPGKSIVIPHSYDPALLPAPAPRQGEKLRFVFTGQLNALRRALPLLEAIRRLRRDRPGLPARAEFLFFGEMGDADLAFLLREGLGDLVFVHGPVPYRQSLAEAARADWLLHIDAELSAVCNENPFFAGKLADYFGLRKPILAVTMPRGAAAETLRRAGALVLSTGVNEIKQALDRIIYGGLRIDLDEAFLRRFSAAETARLFDEQVVKPLLCRPNGSKPW